jgi:hypothetical protein
MATNNFNRWIKNIHGLPMLTKRMPFAAGSTRTVKAGEMLSINGGVMVLQSADAAMTAELCFAAEEIKTADPAGRYLVIVPQPGDVFRSELATASNPAEGASVYFDGSTTEKVALSGSNAIGQVYDHNGIPPVQNHAESGGGDVGNTVGNATHIDWIVKTACSLNALFQG